MKRAAKPHLASDGLPAPVFPQVKGRLPPLLVRCPGCGQHLYDTALTCVHCGADQLELKKQQLKAFKAAQRAAATLKRLFGKKR
jgi:hypothetical protein